MEYCSAYPQFTPRFLGLGFFVGPKLFLKNSFFAQKSHFWTFSRLYKTFEKDLIELHFVKMNTVHVLINTNFLDFQNIFVTT
eukprot:UN15547